MTKFWGLLLALAITSAAQADDWQPYMGVTALPHVDFNYTKYEYSIYGEPDSSTTLTGTGIISFRLDAGVQGERWILNARYYHIHWGGEWAREEYTFPHIGPFQIVGEGESSFEDWREMRITLGAQYYPRGTDGNRLKFFLGGGLGFGQVWYNEIYEGYYIWGEPEIAEHSINRDRKSEPIFSQYGELGGKLRLSDRFDMVLGYELHHASIPLSPANFDRNLHNTAHNWFSSFQLGLRFKFVQEE